jgi:hypothetical protein
MSTAAVAHGRAAHAVLTWLHSRPVKPISLGRAIDHAADPSSRDRDGLEEAIRLALAGAAGEMIHLNADATHLAADRPDVQAAMRHASRLPGDPVDHLERCLEDVLACLHSPKVRHAVAVLADALLKTPRGELTGDAATKLMSTAVCDRRSASADYPGHPRKIIIRRAPRG